MRRLKAGSIRLSVLIPTWRRPAEVIRCLGALRVQTRTLDEVIVTVRKDDSLTLAALQDFERSSNAPTGTMSVTTDPVPLTAAMNAGLAHTTGDLVALTDDDAEPRPDWLERLTAPFADPSVGGVGGRDWQAHERWDEPDVGRVSWFGRVVGNHHLGSGPARDVDLLKGVNCCFRGDILRRIGFDRRLRGKGNVTHWELSLCLALKREGWRLIYDPAIAVDHHVAPRHDGDTNARGQFESRSHSDSVHNESLVIWEHLATPSQKAAYLAWAFAVGTREAPGLLQIPRLMLEGRKSVVGRWHASVRGRLAALTRRPAKERVVATSVTAEPPALALRTSLNPDGVSK